MGKIYSEAVFLDACHGIGVADVYTGTLCRRANPKKEAWKTWSEPQAHPAGNFEASHLITYG